VARLTAVLAQGAR